MNKKFKIIYLLMLCSISLFAQKEGQARIDSLFTTLQSYSSSNDQSADTSKVALLIELAYEYHKIDPDKGLKYGEQAFILSDKLNWKKGKAMAYNRIGLCYWAKSDYPQALESHFKSLEINEEINYKKGIAIVLGNIGLVYDGQQDYAKALEYHFKAMKMNEALADNSGVARNLGNIGMAYDAKGDYTNSLEYYFKALKMYETLGDKNGVARNLGNIGFVYNEQNNHLKALEYHFKALKMNQELGNKILTGLNLGNIGAEYLNIARDTVAARVKSLPDSLNKTIVLHKGQDYLQKSIAIYKEIGDLNSLQELYLYLSDLQALAGNDKGSLLSYKQYITARDSVFSEVNKNKIARLEKNREEDLKQKEIELLKSQNEVERLTAQRRKGINYGLGGAFIGLCFVTVAFFNQSKKRERINNELQKAFTELKEMQAELLKQENLASLGKLTMNLAHEIQNPLNFVTNFSDVSEGLSDELLAASTEAERNELIHTLKQNLSKITFHGKRAGSIVKKMQQHVNEGKGLDLFGG